MEVSYDAALTLTRTPSPNQERYRAKQKKRVTDLEDDVGALASEIEDLNVQLHWVSSGISTKQTVWGVATEYFRLFQYGLSGGALYEYAMSFLQKSMSPGVADGFEYGPEKMLENLRLLSLLFDGFNVRLNGLMELGTHSVNAITTTRITFSKSTLLRAFPLLDSNEVELSSLATKLNGKTLALRGSVCFDWDDKSGCVVGIYSQSDLLTPLLRMLGNLNDVARVFDGALVTPGFRVAAKARNNAALLNAARCCFRPTSKLGFGH
ncbi:hypothetical protein GN244_ATG13591 [Phytophthora infestans]|uniref:Bzip transcription factor n=1 Tax=Phytophthora infestans TaxID=4787 RepID=A0A833WC41_PHYIN|nr:hypothetical protein GN244_ATG20597 [Phytophthora infestans]KAF4034385.1 hypothetical protein GN244_ATG13591 [Phytophthora infestans]